MVHNDHQRGGDQHLPIAVEGQNRQRAEHVKMRFDAPAGQMNQQGGHEHLPDGDGMAGQRPARLDERQAAPARLVISPPRNTAAQTCR